MNREERKKIALVRMQELDIYKPYIQIFKDKNVVTFFERNDAGFWATADNGHADLEAKIREIEAEKNVTIYAVAHMNTVFGELYDFLYVDDEYDEFEKDEKFQVFWTLSYCWNVNTNILDHSGIGVKSLFGGIARMS